MPQKKEVVTFYSADSLLITADLYFSSDSLPYLILIHEQGSSRGEFSSIADRFQKMNYNCLAVDIRNGGNTNFIANETAKRCRTKGYSRNVPAIESDILAAIQYAEELSGMDVILVGAGANGSLALKIAKEQANVKAALAMSPGEFYRPLLSIEDTIAGVEKPLLITGARAEEPYMKQLLSNVSEENYSIYIPQEAEGAHGTKALLAKNPSNGDYWLAVLLFFKDLQ